MHSMIEKPGMDLMSFAFALEVNEAHVWDKDKWHRVAGSMVLSYIFFLHACKPSSALKHAQSLQQFIFMVLKNLPETLQQEALHESSSDFHSKSRAKNSTATLPRFPQQKEDTKLHSNATAVSTGKVEVKTSHESSRYFYRKSRGQNSTATLPRFKGIGFKNSHWHSVTIVTLCDHCHCHRLKVSMNDF